jgi:hypothetical protein
MTLGARISDLDQSSNVSISTTRQLGITKPNPMLCILEFVTMHWFFPNKTDQRRGKQALSPVSL